MTVGNMPMKTTRQTIKALMISCSVLALAGALLAVDGWAQTAETEGSTEPNISAQQEAQEAPDLSVDGSQDTAREERERRQAFRETRRKVQLERIRLAKESPAQNEAVSAAVARPAALTGIEVSFKLDPRLTKSMYMGENWVSPPLSIHADGQAGTTPSVEARVQGLDAKGQPVNLSPEWVPADPEMVTVTPGQGNEVQITVRHAGQSNLQVTSQKVSKRLSIMAWYQGDAIQVEISEKP
jgi:hypothetical protein